MAERDSSVLGGNQQEQPSKFRGRNGRGRSRGRGSKRHPGDRGGDEVEPKRSRLSSAPEATASTSTSSSVAVQGGTSAAKDNNSSRQGSYNNSSGSKVKRGRKRGNFRSNYQVDPFGGGTSTSADNNTHNQQSGNRRGRSSTSYLLSGRANLPPRNLQDDHPSFAAPSPEDSNPAEQASSGIGPNVGNAVAVAQLKPGSSHTQERFDIGGSRRSQTSRRQSFVNHLPATASSQSGVNFPVNRSHSHYKKKYSEVAQAPPYQTAPVGAESSPRYQLRSQSHLPLPTAGVIGPPSHSPNGYPQPANSFSGPSTSSVVASTSNSSSSGVTSGYSQQNKHSKSKRVRFTNETLGGSESRELSAPKTPLYKRRSRSSTTTGSCASTSRRSPRGGRVKLPLAAEGSSSSGAGMAARDEASTPNTPTNNLAPLMENNDNEASAGRGGPSGSNASSATGATNAGAERDSESDDSEVGRLQALLEARGLPPHLLGALGPRMQHLLHRSIGQTPGSEAQQLLQGLQASGDEGQQLQAVIEMCQMLVMGNEDTLAGFPIKQVVAALIALLSMEHNFDMMNHACRALTYMMEALPRSSGMVLDAVPVFLEKLQAIHCMDVAEQSLTALEMLSRRHSKAILQANGITACLKYLDFFSINAQRAALSITANCCHNLHMDEFHLVRESLPMLASRLDQADKKCVESVCLAFCRLVDSFPNDPVKLKEIASCTLLTNVQHLLAVSPPIISTPTFITVLRMLSIICANCPDLSLVLLKQNIADTLKYLLTGLTGPNTGGEVELIPRSPQELLEITSLIGELMPRLPQDGIFAVDNLLDRQSPGSVPEGICWQWKDDRGFWRAYSPIDSRIIEAAHLTGEDEMVLTLLSRTYTVDFLSMRQINEDSGTSRPIQRRVAPPSPSVGNQSATGSSESGKSNADNSEGNSSSESEMNDVAACFIRSLFSILYEVYSSSAGPAVRCKCLRALLRMVYYGSPELLQDVLKAQIVSSHLAGMMASQELKIVVGALQMAEILMQKLPNEFAVHFYREGVMHKIQELADPNSFLFASPPKFPPQSDQNSMLPGPSGGQAANFNLPTTSNGNVQKVVNNLFMDHHPGCNIDKKFSECRTSNSNPSIVNNNQSLSNHPGTSTSTNIATTNNPNSNTTATTSSASSTSVPTSKSKTIVVAFNNTTPDEKGMPTNSASELPQVRLGDVLKRKRNQEKRLSKTRMLAGTSSKRNSRQDPNNSINSSPMNEFFTPRGSSSKFRLGVATSKTSSFLASLNPARWGRSDRMPCHKDSSNLSKCNSNVNLSAGNREKARAWVKERAASFVSQYRSGTNVPTKVLDQLVTAIGKLNTNKDEDVLSGLGDLRNIFMKSDVSPFEVNHSGLIRFLLGFLTRATDATDSRDERLRKFLHIFLNAPLDGNGVDLANLDAEPFSALVSKLNGCVAQLEQFPVKVHELPAGTGSMTALKFLNTHQLKCHLVRHPECTVLKQWKRGTVKIDPLALVQAVEKYLVSKGYHRQRDKDSGDSDDENSEEDIDDTLAAVGISQGSTRHKLQFLINDHILPHNMTVYQAIRQFSPAAFNDQSETDTDSEAPLGSTSIWVQTHTIHYRPLNEEEGAGTSLKTGSTPNTRKSKGSSSKGSSRKRQDNLWQEGSVPTIKSPLEPFLDPNYLLTVVTTRDESVPVLILLRVLHSISRYWSTLYTANDVQPLLKQQEFLNSKIAAKASRQLQDPLVIITGNLPPWLSQMASACPFLLPFETRQLLFYATSFDRDRALHRLLDCSPELSNATDSQDRVTPRLDRRKRTVSRDDILKQAELVLLELASSKALLEIQYENEVGTGLGPTLEFYALVSKELQRADLDLWINLYSDRSSSHVFSPNGLFPVPLGRTAKVSQVVKIRSKFRFLGKLMAKAVMDSRMLDLPLSLTFYRWLLGEEAALSLSDLAYVSPSVHATLVRFESVINEFKKFKKENSSVGGNIEIANKTINIDGCPIIDLGLDFTLPGYPNLELKKGGKDIDVTLENLEEYSKLVCHWYLVEGVQRQMESFREGFESVFPLFQLKMFYPEELEAMFCGSSTSWDVRMLKECCRFDHGYNSDSMAIHFLFEVLSSYNMQEQRDFIQFVTGSPRLPVGGFKSLSPPLTVVRKTLEKKMSPDDFLPSVMTCVNYLKLPDYSSVIIMKEKLAVAAREGQRSFLLS